MSTLNSLLGREETREGIIVGLDLGGTDIKRGVSSPDGAPISDVALTVKLPSRVKEGPAATLEQFRIGIDAIQQHYQARMLAIGLSTAGPAYKNGQIQQSTNYGPEWHYFNVREAVENEFGVPTVYENDANAAALAEYMALTQRDGKFLGTPGILVTIGTGLGGGVINSSGELDRGYLGLGAELGHLPIRNPISSVNLEDEQIQCGCDEIGCAEQYTTLSFIERELQRRLLEDSGHQLAGVSDSREAAKCVLALAGQGDALCLAILTDQARNVGRFLGDQIIDKDPAWVLIGGGITEATANVRKNYFNVVLYEIERRIKATSFAKRHFDFASLGDNAGWVGANISASEMLRAQDSP